MIYLTETWALTLDTYKIQILTCSCQLTNHRHSSALLRPSFSRGMMFFHTASSLHQVINSVCVNFLLYFSEISAILTVFYMTKTVKDCQLFKSDPQTHEVESVVGSPPACFSSSSDWIWRCSSPKMVLDPRWLSSEACTEWHSSTLYSQDKVCVLVCICVHMQRFLKCTSLRNTNEKELSLIKDFNVALILGVAFAP